MNIKFLLCKHCGNMVELIKDGGPPMICCGEQITELIPNTVEASAEKHLPIATVSGDLLTVQIGSVPHPMEEKHHIEFIYVQTERGGQRKFFQVGEEPTLTFNLANDKSLAVFAYCNIHGLWKTEM